MASENVTRTVTYPTTGRGTINTGTTLNVAFGVIRIASSALVRNFDTTNDIYFTLNGGTDRTIVDAGKTIEINGEKIQSIILGNVSGSAVEYQVVLYG